MTSLIENLARIKTTFDDIKNAILSKGVTPGDTVDTYANSIMEIYTGGVDTRDTTATENDVKAGTYFHIADGSLKEGNFEGQSKTAAPSVSSQEITPDAGKYLELVTIDPISVQDKSVAPTESVQNVIPDDGYYLNSVTVDKIQTQTKTVSASTTSKTVTPDSGKYLTKVTVNAIPEGEADWIEFDEFGYASISTSKDGWFSGLIKSQIMDTAPTSVAYAKTSEQTIIQAGKTYFFGNGFKIGKLSHSNLTSANILSGKTVTINNGSTNVYTVAGSAKRTATGTVTTTANTSKTVELGWKPSYVALFRNRSTSNTMANLYYNGTNLNVSTGGSSATTTVHITPTSNGFTISSQGTYYGTCYYIAVE